MIDFERKPVIACIHLLPTVGSHKYDGEVERIYETAMREARVLIDCGVDALIVENFRDGPFYPGRVPPETIATVAGVTREIVGAAGNIPVGVAVLRNDAEAALAIATATNAAFIRVNVHVGAVLAAQGVVEGKSHETLRLRHNLKSNVAIYADAGVKHSIPWVYPKLSEEIRDLAPHADAIIVSGSVTGVETDVDDVALAKKSSSKPVLIGSGVTPQNLSAVYELADGFIVGSYFKVDGIPANPIDVRRVEKFMSARQAVRSAAIA